jgi:hypothetical protein
MLLLGTKTFHVLTIRSWVERLNHLIRQVINELTHSLLMSYIYGAPSKARNLTSCVCIYIYIYRQDFLLGILLLEPCISLIYA